MFTGRGEAQVLRLSMLYALLDGSAIIDVPHLRAALAVWRYCEASARIIFHRDGEETNDPLEMTLLAAIRRQPGVNRKGLHRALGGHTPAEQMVKALARLRDKGFVRVETVTTGGRPGECWHPRDRTNNAVVPPVASPQLAVTEITPEAKVSSFARGTPSALTLAELFTAVKEMKGHLVRRGEAVVVESPNCGSPAPARKWRAGGSWRRSTTLPVPRCCS